MSAQLQALIAQLASLTAAKNAAVAKMNTAIAELGPNYTDGGKAGSDSLDSVGYIRALSDVVKSLTEQELALTKQIARMQPGVRYVKMVPQ